MEIAVTVLVCLVNLVLWGVFLKKFKRLFSTDDIIASTRGEMSKMADALNRETARDLRLADDKLKSLEKAVADAESRLEELNEEMLRRLREYRESMDAPRAAAPRYFSQAKSPAMQYANNLGAGGFSIPPLGRQVGRASSSSSAAVQTPPPAVRSPAPVPVSAPEPPTNAASAVPSPTVSAAFASAAAPVPPAPPVSAPRPQAATPVVAQPAVAASAVMPPSVVPPSQGPVVTFAAEPVVPKLSLNERVLDLYAKGMDVPLIARELGATTTEVQLIIDMNS